MKTVLVTGGSRGIGEAVARAFGKAGWRVALLSRSRPAELLSELLKSGIDAAAFSADVSDPAAVERAFLEFDRFSRRLDCIVTCAGISQNLLFTDITPELWNEMIATDLSGTFYCLRQSVKRMLPEKSGSIITVSSMWGQTGASCEVHYSAAKAGVIGLTRALAKELAPSGIRANCICPGVIDTDMFKVYSESDRELITGDIPLGRPGKPEEVASAALFLTENGYVTGQVIGVNGGSFIG